MLLTILDIGPETIQLVGHMLEDADISNLRLTCKRLGEILEFSILSSITLDINNKNFAKSIPRLRALAAGRFPRTAQSTTSLTLVCFSPRRDPANPSARLLSNGGVTASEGSTISPTITPDVSEAERRLKKYLLDAILSLKNVVTVRWFTHKRDEPWVQDTIMKALKGLPRLENLRIEATWLQVVLPLQRLQHLHEIWFTNAPLSDEKNFYKTCSNLAKLLARNSHITCVHLDRARNPELPSLPTDPGSSLHSLLLGCPADTLPLHLHHLGLRHMFVKLDHITLPHLQHLRSLDLSFMLNPHHHGFARSDSGSPTLAEGEHAVGSHIDHVWDALGKSHIYLEEVALTDVTPAFLSYMEHYSGLRKISISSTGHGKDLDELGMRFWNTSLRKHVKSIKKLAVNAPSEGKWTVDEHTLDIIKQCHLLTSLQVSVSSGDRITHDSDGDDFENIVVLLIDNVSCYLHNFRDLTISTPTAGGIEAKNMVISQLEAYVAPPSCNQLPSVLVGARPHLSKVYIPGRAMGSQARFESGEWHYLLENHPENRRLELP